MSNIMVHDIVGTEAYAIPTSMVEGQAATNGFRALIAVDPGVPLLVVDSRNVRAWVIDSQGASGEEGTRSLACLLSDFTYGGNVCPTEGAVDQMVAAIRAAFLGASGIGTITSVGAVEVNLFNGGSVGP
jgi:hypothetical protein